MTSLNKLSTQQDLESLYNKNQVMTRLKKELLSSEFDFLSFFEEIDLPEKFALNLLCQMILHKRTNLPTMVGLLYKYADSPQQVADYLKIAAEHDLIDWDVERQEFVVAVDISADVQADLDRYQYPLPMIVKPKLLKCNTDSGYLTGSSSVILKDNHHEKDVVLDHLNRMNQTALRINHDVVDYVQNQWRNLDKQKEGETYADFRKRKKAFEKYNRTAKEVIATVTEESEKIYLTHRFDKRGRTYCQGYHVNYQGNPWNKSCLEFYNGEPVI